MEKILSLGRVRVGSSALDRILLALFFFLATALGAYVEIPLPFTPVPLTLQTFFVLLGAVALGGGWSASVQSAYLGAGALGAGFFAGGAAGLFHLWGPTAGYLWAFLPASLLVGTIYSRCSTAAGRVVLLSGAALLILACGGVWLALFMGLSAKAAFVMGVAPFLPGEALKVAAVVSASPFLARR